MQKRSNLKQNIQSSSRPRAADAAALALDVDPKAAEPLHLQLSRQLRGMILSGRIDRGARLPSSRVLAGDLGVSRATVVLAYDQLRSEGYVEGRAGAGIFASSSLPEQSLQVEATRNAAKRPKPYSAPHTPEPARPFLIGNTDPALFSYKQWSRALYRIWRDPEPALLGGIDPFGWYPLRRAIAQHLAQWRGIVCDPAQVVVTSGTADATEVIAHCAFGPGTTVCVEEPGYPTLRYALDRYGIKLVPIGVDDDGIDAAKVVATRVARGVFVTPSRQFPLGGTLPLARRLELLDWAAASDSIIVEDDFDSEYRYQGSPLPALSSLDRQGRTIYVGSFSKVLLPTLRLGFIVLPERFIETVRKHLRRRGAMASLVAQPVVGDLIASGEYATHIRRTRRIYARRMAALVDESWRLEGLLEVAPTMAGMHVVAWMSTALLGRMSDRQAADRARTAGIIVAPLADFYAGKPQRSALLLGFAGFGEDELRVGIRRLADVLAK